MINKKHPRAISLKIRDKIVHGVKIGITSTHGLIAQGRGEAFDYLIGEKTQKFAENALEAAAAALILAKYPVLSVNGNSAVLCPDEYVTISNLLNCPIEVNLFHRTLEREKKIRNFLLKHGAKNVVGIGEEASEVISAVASERKHVSPNGIQKADVVFVPLEDGDRTEALIKLGKKVITIDLNPFSRTAQKASITIVDNIVRAMPMLITYINNLRLKKPLELSKISSTFNNQKMLRESCKWIKSRLTD